MSGEVRVDFKDNVRVCCLIVLYYDAIKEL